ncbi:MAG: Snf7 family protein [Candidatus Bathyarchaeia archaeon]
MSDNLVKNWDRELRDSMFQRLEDKVHKIPLRERVSQASYRLKLLQERLEQASKRMQNHDKELFDKCVAAELSKDPQRAIMYANECAEVRKMAKVLLLSQLAIERVLLRLETVREFGDVIVEMAPISGVIHALKGRLAGVIPEVSYELAAIGEMMNGMIVEAGDVTGSTYNVTTINEESKRILNEAGTIAEQRIKEKFPELPTAYRAATSEREFTSK